MTPLTDIERATWRALRPPPKLRLSEWTGAHVVLPATLAAAPGRMRLFPYQHGMADSMGDPTVERVTVLKSARIGYTQLAVAALAHYAASDPAPTLAVLPAEADARHLMTGVIEPTFRESPALADLLTADAYGRDTMLARQFPGGSLKLVSANAPRNLRAVTARVLIADELDGWEVDARGEGDPLVLAEKRTFSFADRKIICGSTPVDEETSRICRLYDASDKRVWEVPCPHCGDFHEIAWKDISWPEGRPEEAAWACPSCGAVTEDREKAPMLLAGRWRATAPHVEGHHGYRINALSSLLPNAAWGKLAAEFVIAKRSPVTLKPFVNTILGEPWRGDNDEIDPTVFDRLREPLSADALPRDVLWLTAGVDLQGDRMECSLVGWTEQGDARVIEHGMLFGSPVEEGTWADLEAWLTRQFRHPLGGVFYLAAALIDSGNWTEAVYAFCRPRGARRIVAAKGVAGPGRPALTWSTSRKARIALVGVDGLKRSILERVKHGGTLTFADDLPADYFDQLRAERRVIRFSHGQPQERWELIPGRRNEALDCLCYATAAFTLVSRDPTRRRGELASVPTAPRSRVARSRFVSGV